MNSVDFNRSYDNRLLLVDFNQYPLNRLNRLGTNQLIGYCSTDLLVDLTDMSSTDEIG